MKWTDEQIVAAILAGASQRPNGLAPGKFGLPFEGAGEELNEELIAGPCCAIGAGCLFTGVPTFGETALGAFAKFYGVSTITSVGVSDGFEFNGSYVSCCTGYSITSEERRSKAYERGYAIGAAVRSAIESGDS